MSEGVAAFLVLGGALSVAIGYFRWYEAPLFRSMDWFGLLDGRTAPVHPRWVYCVVGLVLIAIGAAQLARRLIG